jgi:hypothetical protein
MTEPVLPPPVAPGPPSLSRNKLGITALVLVLIAVVLPIIAFVLFLIGAVIEGAEGDDFGYSVIGAFLITGAASSLIAPIAILGLILGVISLFRPGQRKVQGILAIIFGVVPSVFILGLPVAIDTFF